MDANECQIAALPILGQLDCLVEHLARVGLVSCVMAASQSARTCTILAVAVVEGGRALVSRKHGPAPHLLNEVAYLGVGGRALATDVVFGHLSFQASVAMSKPP
jgi:hypothetical protein